jgi:hypothetical protein
LAARVAWKSVAVSDAMRSGGFSASVPWVVEVEVTEVGELEPPQAASEARPAAAMKGRK